MYRNRRFATASAARLDTRRRIRLAGSLLLLAGLAWLADSDAASGLCQDGRCGSTTSGATATPDRGTLDFAATRRLSAPGTTGRRGELSSQEFFSFSGVGAIVCTVNGEQRMATAFLVGAFDIGVTVAHTFEGPEGTAPENCIYTSTDSLGQIRERIPVISIKSQWASEAGAAGHAAKDFAVIRLSEPSNYAQRTMPLGKFSGAAVAVLMIGFRSDMESDPMKSKSRGTVYERKVNGLSLASLEGFTHDIDARGIASGSPVIDERTGVIIGIHTVPSRQAAGVVRNTMITMNDWLEQTLRTEMQAGDEKGANSNL